jgi:hypothetical protein
LSGKEEFHYGSTGTTDEANPSSVILGAFSDFAQILLLYLLRNRYDPALGVFKGEFTHSVELFFQRHGDLCSALLHSGEDFFDPFYFDEEGKTASNGLGP